MKFQLNMSKINIDIFDLTTARGLVMALSPKDSLQKLKWVAMASLSENGLSFQDINSLICSFPIKDIHSAIKKALSEDFHLDFASELVKICERLEEKRASIFKKKESASANAVKTHRNRRKKA